MSKPRTLSLSRRDRKLLVVALTSAIQNEEEFLGCQRTGYGPRGERVVPKGNQATANRTRRFIASMRRLQKKLRESLEPARAQA